MNEQKNNPSLISNVLFLLLLMVLGYLLFNFATEKFHSNNNQLSTDKASKSQNILLLGVDPSNNLTDTIIVINYNSTNSRISLLSIPRDTQIVINNSLHKINSVYAMNKGHTNGAIASKNAVSNLLNLKIDNYILINTSSFKRIIDTLGGVDFNVPCDLKYDDSSQNLHIDLKKGFQHLDGKKAEQLLRFRKPQNNNYAGLAGYYDGSDLKRIDMQQNFIRELIKQNLSFRNIPALTPIIDEIVKNSDTSLSFSDILNTITNIMLNSNSINSENIKIFKLNGTAQNINGSSYFIYNHEILDKHENKSYLTSEIINTFFAFNHLPE